MSAPRFLAVFTSAIVLATVVAGCATTTPSGTASSTPHEGGTIVFATDREPGSSLDPSYGGDITQSLIARQYLDSLVRQEDDGTLTPWLATSWEVSEDGTVYTFHLRDDVTFSDGTPFNAESVKANVEHWLDPETYNSEATNSLKDFQGIEVPDEYTVSIDIGTPYADFLSVLASSFSGIQSPAGIARGNEENGLAPIGSGPFIVESWEKGSQVTLVRNDDYDWAPKTADHQGAAYADEIIWRFIPEGLTRYAALQSGEIDVLETIPPESFTDAKASENQTIIDGIRTGVPVQLDFNTTRAPFDDVRVRQAFRLATDDRAAVESVFFGAYKSFGGSLSPNTLFYDESFEDAYPFDIDKANDLLDDAGWAERDADGYRVKDGKRLTAEIIFTAGTQQDYFLGDQFQGTAKEAGFDVVYEKLDTLAALEKRADWDYDLAKDYWGGPNTASALNYLYLSAYNASDDSEYRYHNNGTGFVDADLDAALEAAIVTSDERERQASYSEAQKIISDESLNFPLYLQPLQYSYRNDLVQGVNVDPRSKQVSFYDTWVREQ